MKAAWQSDKYIFAAQRRDRKLDQRSEKEDRVCKKANSVRKKGD
jgi:hypothetical protein